MKTFKQFLTESSEEFSQVLERDCAPFLDTIGWDDKPLFRGCNNPGSKHKATVNGEPLEYEVFTTRADRKPLATPLAAHEHLDQYFETEFGWKARSSGLFCSTRYQQAHNYGQVYVVFPMGEFKYIWSPTVYDLYATLENEADKLSTQFKSLTAKQLSSEQILDVLKHADYKDNNFKMALRSENEIMLKCDRWIGVEVESSLRPSSNLSLYVSDLFRSWKIRD